MIRGLGRVWCGLRRAKCMLPGGVWERGNARGGVGFNSGLTSQTDCVDIRIGKIIGKVRVNRFDDARASPAQILTCATMSAGLVRLGFGEAGGGARKEVRDG